MKKTMKYNLCLSYSQSLYFDGKIKTVILELTEEQAKQLENI